MRWLQLAVILPSVVLATLNLKQYRPAAQRVLPKPGAEEVKNVHTKAQKPPKFLTDKTRSTLSNHTSNCNC